MATLDCNQQEQKQEQRLGSNARVAGAKTWSSNCFYKVNFIGGWQLLAVSGFTLLLVVAWAAVYKYKARASHYTLQYSLSLCLSLSPSSFET